MAPGETNPASEASPWQAPPAFVAHALLARIIARELRWGLHITPLRLLSHDWRAAVDGALPVLAPRPFVPADEMAALAERFAGLHLLRLQSPGAKIASGRLAAAELWAAVCHICARGTALRSLHLLDWGRLEDSAQLAPLSMLCQLRHLRLSARSLELGSAAELHSLPQLRCLSLVCRSMNGGALSCLSSLENLELAPAQLPKDAAAELLQTVAQLTRLQGLTLHLWEPGIPVIWLAGLSALQQLTRFGLRWVPDGTAEVAAALLPLLAGPGRNGSGRGLKRLRLELGDVDVSEPVVPLKALSGLEALDAVAYPGLQGAPRSDFGHLSALTFLRLDLGRMAFEAGEADVDAVVEAIGRRLAGLRQLHLLDARYVAETALLELSGLTQLTALSLRDAHDFGGWALAALLPLTRLARLELSATTLNDASLTAVLDEVSEEDAKPAVSEAEAAPPSASAGARTTDEAHPLQQLAPEPPLLQGLTYLCLERCQLLSHDAFVRLVGAMPSLRHLWHRGFPQLQVRHLQRILQGCPQLELLQTTWRPPAAPHEAPAGGYKAAGSEEKLHQLRQQRRQYEEAQAFCRTWHLQLQHSLPQPGADFSSEGYYEFDAAAALEEAGVAL